MDIPFRLNKPTLDKLFFLKKSQHNLPEVIIGWDHLKTDCSVLNFLISKLKDSFMNKREHTILIAATKSGIENDLIKMSLRIL